MINIHVLFWILITAIIIYGFFTVSFYKRIEELDKVVFKMLYGRTDLDRFVEMYMKSGNTDYTVTTYTNNGEKVYDFCYGKSGVLFDYRGKLKTFYSSKDEKVVDKYKGGENGE